MFDGAALPFDENVRITSEVTRIAKAAGVDVEAELGKVGNSGVDTADVFTDVEESKRFVEATGIDALAVAIGNLSTHLNTCLSIDNHYGSLNNIESSHQFTLEVSKTGNVKDVDFLTAKLGVEQRGVDGVAAIKLDVAVVGDGVLVFYGAAAVDHAAIEGHGLSHGGLTRFSAAHEGDVANVVSLVNFHCQKYIY
jgi:fructose/tagatose bisphosphate aldolase